MVYRFGSVDQVGRETGLTSDCQEDLRLQHSSINAAPANSSETVPGYPGLNNACGPYRLTVANLVDGLRQVDGGVERDDS